MEADGALVRNEEPSGVIAWLRTSQTGKCEAFHLEVCQVVRKGLHTRHDHFKDWAYADHNSRLPIVHFQTPALGLGYQRGMKLPTKESDEEEVTNGEEGNRAGPSGNSGEGNEVGAEGGPVNPSNGEAAPDFSEFLWMEHEEEFNEQVLKELEDEEMVNYYFELYQASIEAELNTGQSTGPIMRVPPPPTYLESHGHADDRVDDLSRGFNRMNFSSSLNPEAAEFVPRGGGHDFINKDSTS